jgi:trimeric autotransporter adhesin
MVHLRSIAIILSALAAPAGAQSILQTILGAVPDGVPAANALLSNPVAVTADRDGNVYAALTGGHQVVRIDKGGAVWVVAGNGSPGTSGDGGPARLAAVGHPVALALDNAGSLYIADSLANRVRRVTPDGVISTFAGTGISGRTGDGGPAAQARLAAPSGLALDAGGNLLIVETGNQIVRSVSVDGRISSLIGKGTRGNTGNGGPASDAYLNLPSGIAIDRLGNIFIADTGNGWIRRVGTDGIITRYAGLNNSSTRGFGGEDPTLATNVVLASPTGVAVDSGGNVYFVEAGSARVRRISADGRLSSYAGIGKGGNAGDGGVARAASLNVAGIAVDQQDNLLIADGINHRLRIVTIADAIIETLAGAGIASYDPRSVAVSGDMLYFADTAADTVRRYDLASGEVAAAAGEGISGFQGDQGTALAARLNEPRGAIIDAAGRLLIADSGNHRVRAVAKDNVISTIAGSGEGSTKGDGGLATSASLYEPVGVAADRSGNLFIAERLGNVVRKVSPGGAISTVAGTGTAGPPDAETGLALAQRLNSPRGIALDSSGGLLIADSLNNRVRRLSSDGTITTIMGTGVGGSSGDGGPAIAATLRSPSDVAADAYGNLYVADTGNHKIRRITPEGIVTTIAGTGTAGYNGDGSPASVHQLNSPSAVAIAPNCSIIVADTQNQRLRRIWLATDYVISSDPPGVQVTIDGGAATTPVTVAFLPGTQHRIDAPALQDGPAGIRYLFSSEARSVDVPCGPARAKVNLAFHTQYRLDVSIEGAGSVNNAGEWHKAGTALVLTATPDAGSVFVGWQGDCQGNGPCQLTMDGPKRVKAAFVR